MSEKDYHGFQKYGLYFLKASISWVTEFCADIIIYIAVGNCSIHTNYY
jgi:hypothetical protein